MIKGHHFKSYAVLIFAISKKMTFSDAIFRDWAKLWRETNLVKVIFDSKKIHLKLPKIAKINSEKFYGAKINGTKVYDTSNRQNEKTDISYTITFKQQLTLNNNLKTIYKIKQYKQH